MNEELKKLKQISPLEGEGRGYTRMAKQAAIEGKPNPDVA